MKIELTLVALVIVMAGAMAGIYVSALQIFYPPELLPAENCIQKDTVWISHKNRSAEVWWIEGTAYAVRGNEVLGRWSRFYPESYLDSSKKGQKTTHTKPKNHEK